MVKKEVEQYLEDFKHKMSIWSIIFRDDRSKNTIALSELEITPRYREDVLRKLNAIDYCEGPLQEKLHGGTEMWVFGRQLKGKEVYIKISMGFAGKSTICISFHIAGHALIIL